MTPRPYQTDILSKVDAGWKDFRKQLVVSPTGSGKTQMFSWMAKKEFDSGKRTLILVDQDELVWQAVDKLKRSTGINAEVEKAEFRASKMASVVVASVQSMVRRLSQWAPDTFDLVIADEADKSLAATWQKTLNYFDPTARVCGFTATPKRSDQRSLGEYYENVAAEYSLRQVIQLGYLAKVCIQMAPIKINLDGIHIKNGDFDLHEVDHAITPYLGSVVDAIQKYASDRKTLVFLPLIRTSQAFVSICKDRGLLAEHIDGESDDRKDILERFARREFSILACSLLLTRGFDDPTIDCIVPLRLTKSETLYQQMCGRGTRLAEGKKDMLLLDFLYQSTKNLVCRPASLIAKTQEEAEEITSLSERKEFEGMGSDQVDLMDLASEVAHTREEALRKKLEAMANRKAKFISAAEFAVKHNQMEIAEFEPTMKWHFEPPTPKQVEWIEKAGVDPETVTNKGLASAVLGVYFGEKSRQPASPKVKRLMAWKGWRSSDNLRGPDQATQADAKDFFASGVMKR